MTVGKYMAGLLAVMLLGGCVTSKPTLEKLPSAEVDLVQLAASSNEAYTTTFEAVDRAVLLQSTTEILTERGYEVTQSSLDPFIVIGRKAHTFTTGELITKGIITGIFGGSTVPDKNIEFYYSITASPVEGGKKLKISSRAMRQTNKTNGTVARHGMASFKNTLIDAIVERASGNGGAVNAS